MTTSSLSSSCISIIDLFKTSKPRTKLFIQLIPPGYTEDEFKELILSYADRIDYMVFRPGKIIRDSYGYLIGMDCPDYGFAVINLKSPKTCPKFFREFNQMPLSDSYSKNERRDPTFIFTFLDIKSKLLVEFAPNQDIPDLSVSASLDSNNLCLRELPIFKEFLKTFPFAAKAEEERKSSLGPVKIDLEDDKMELEMDYASALPIKSNELDTKLSFSNSPIVSPTLPPVTYSSIIQPAKFKEVLTPLTEFFQSNRDMIENQLPAAKTVKQSKDKNTREVKEKKSFKKAEAKKEKLNSSKNSKPTEPVKPIEKKSFKTAPPTEKKLVNTHETQQPKQNSKQKRDSLVKDSPQSAQIRGTGTPRILARKPVATEIPFEPLNATLKEESELLPKLLDDLICFGINSENDNVDVLEKKKTFEESQPQIRSSHVDHSVSVTKKKQPRAPYVPIGNNEFPKNEQKGELSVNHKTVPSLNPAEAPKPVKKRAPNVSDKIKSKPPREPYIPPVVNNDTNKDKDIPKLKTTSDTKVPGKPKTKKHTSEKVKMTREPYVLPEKLEMTNVRNLQPTEPKTRQLPHESQEYVKEPKKKPIPPKSESKQETVVASTTATKIVIRTKSSIDAAQQSC